MLNKKGLLIVVSGPSGVGKGSVCKALIKRNPCMKFSVSATTRNSRKDEHEGISYFFKSRQEFEKMIGKGEFLEYMLLFNNNYYGTPRGYVEKELEAGNDIILEIDVQGAVKVKQAYHDAVMVFIVPPAMSDLKSRLIVRDTETEHDIDDRLAVAMKEIEFIDKYDYVVVNDVIEKAVSKIEAIVSAEKSSVARNKDFLPNLTGRK